MHQWVRLILGRTSWSDICRYLGQHLDMNQCSKQAHCHEALYNLPYVGCTDVVPSCSSLPGIASRKIIAACRGGWSAFTMPDAHVLEY